MKVYRTSDVAKIIGVHNNTIIAYEKSGYISNVERSQNGYRIYTDNHIEQIKLARLVLKSDIIKVYMIFKVREILKTIARNEFDIALDLSKKFLLQIQVEKTSEFKLIKELKELIRVHIDNNKKNISLKRSEVSKEIDVSMDVIINWERNGLLEIPRNNKNNYRIYSEHEIILLKAIKLIRKENYSTQCIGNMIRKIKANNFEFIYKEDELLSTIGDREKDVKNLISHLNNLIKNHI